jgi:hypothetical protein
LFTGIKSTDHRASSNQNMPVTWHGPEPGIGLRASAKLSQIPYSFDNTLVANEVFPEGELDADLQQVDLRKTNSWRLRLGQIETTEMIEVQLVNSVAPFVLCSLSEIMKKDNTGKTHHKCFKWKESFIAFLKKTVILTLIWPKRL